MNYYYKLRNKSELGKAFRQMWNMCIKAERAADNFARKVGAVTFYPQDSAFAGGVACVAFKDNVCPKPDHWRSIGKDADKQELWVPNVKQRIGTLVVSNAKAMPGNVANRIYGKRPTVNQQGQLVLQYVELYRDDEASKSRRRGYKLSWAAKESIRIEKERLTLPVVKTETILTLLKADPTFGKADDGKSHLVRLVTPTFFAYWNHIYIGIAYPCHAEDLQEIMQADYIEAEKAVRELQRDTEVAN